MQLALRLTEEGGWVQCLICPCLTFQTDACWRCRAPPLQISHQTPLISPRRRLLSCDDCVMGPFSGAQEIPHSAEVTVVVQSVFNFSNYCFLLGVTPPPIFKNNKSPHSCREPGILFIQAKEAKRNHKCWHKTELHHQNSSQTFITKDNC